MSASNPVVGLIVVLLLAILLVLTNPFEEMHRKAPSQEYGREHPVAGSVGLGEVSASAARYRSFVLGSSTVEDDTVTSIGALGMVWPTQGPPR